MAELVFDAVEQILVRLDAEDLIRCKIVCKSWRSLISSPSFGKHHLNHSHKSDRDNRQLGHRRIGSLATLDEDEEYFSRNKSFIIGSCNGLVCLSTMDLELVVTNPLTRELKRLPTPPYGPHDCFRYGSLALWGFGYDSSANDYKVVVGFREA
ncbi:F-box protein CPR1-like [Bidens hawaiensis]|uniref:F-box protein CPR1-like n=1 Tax=Bidens hawaiensis TaxID=980011 RepID=UPI0040491DC4